MDILTFTDSQFLLIQEIVLKFDKELLATSSWLFTERADEAICASIDARRKNRWGTLTMRFLDVAWQPRLDSL